MEVLGLRNRSGPQYLNLSVKHTHTLCPTSLPLVPSLAPSLHTCSIILSIDQLPVSSWVLLSHSSSLQRVPTRCPIPESTTLLDFGIYCQLAGLFLCLSVQILEN